MKLLPESWMPYAKSWVSLVGVVLVALSTAWEGGPEWLPIAASVTTALGVYLTPNKDHKPRHAHDDTLRA